jgi:hypothetical protein
LASAAALGAVGRGFKSLYSDLFFPLLFFLPISLKVNLERSKGKMMFPEDSLLNVEEETFSPLRENYRDKPPQFPTLEPFFFLKIQELKMTLCQSFYRCRTQLKEHS